jgi:hypothetical protein
MQADILREMGPERRFKTSPDLIETERRLLLEGIRSRHPDDNEQELAMTLRRILLGDKLLIKVYKREARK